MHGTFARYTNADVGSTPREAAAPRQTAAGWFARGRESLIGEMIGDCINTWH